MPDLHRWPVLALLLMLSPLSLAAQAPKWEAGVGLGSLSLPPWRGSGERSTYTAPLPYFVWRGERFKADREGARGLLLQTPSLELDISFDASLPVDSDDDDARAGMDDLDPLLEIGPSLRWFFHDGTQGRWFFRVPLRTAWSVGDGVHAQGWVLTPVLAYRSRYQPQGWRAGFSIGPRFASRDFHEYFYAVSADEVAPGRQQYSAKGGYSGSTLMVSASRRFERVWLGFFARYDNLSGAVFTDSPLVVKEEALMVGAGFAVILGRSKHVVNVQD